MPGGASPKRAKRLPFRWSSRPAGERPPLKQLAGIFGESRRGSLTLWLGREVLATGMGVVYRGRQECVDLAVDQALARDLSSVIDRASILQDLTVCLSGSPESREPRRCWSPQSLRSPRWN